MQIQMLSINTLSDNTLFVCGHDTFADISFAVEW